MRRLAALFACVLLAGCAGQREFFRDAGTPVAAAPQTLAAWPWQELWTGVVFRGNKVGFSRLAIRRVPGESLWELESESALRLRFLGIDKRVSLRALDRVREDLSLVSFRYDYALDGSRLAVEGERDGDVLVVRTESDGVRTEQRLAMAQAALPASALALLPVMRGLSVGAASSPTVFVGESQSLGQAEQRVLGYERSRLFEGAAFKVATRLLGLETESWYDAQGRPLLETALHGAMISTLEDPAAARAYLVEASLSKDESLLDFSLLRSPAIADAQRTAALHIVLEGVPASLEVPQTGGQRCTRQGERLECRIDRRAREAAPEPQSTAPYLRPTLAAPSNERRFVELAQAVAGEAAGAQAKITRLLAWIDANIAKEAIDGFSAADVLRERRGECQGHAYLFAALARAQGLPTRVVNGIVYSPEHGGFLYHTWNEVWIEAEGWRAVDATFAQPVADATHVALVRGEGAAEIAPLAGMVGRARVASVAAVTHW